jgi:hypothetical protein
LQEKKDFFTNPCVVFTVFKDLLMEKKILKAVLGPGWNPRLQAKGSFIPQHA